MRIDRPPWVHIPQRFLSWPSFPRQLKNHSRITKTRNQSHGSIYIQNLEPTPRKKVQRWFLSKKKYHGFFRFQSLLSCFDRCYHLGSFAKNITCENFHPVSVSKKARPFAFRIAANAEPWRPLPTFVFTSSNRLGKEPLCTGLGNIGAVELDMWSLSLLLMVQQSHTRLRWPVLPLFLDQGFIHPRWFVPHFVQHYQYQLPSSTPNYPSNYPLVHQHINGESSCSVRFNEKYIFIISFTVHVPDMTIYSEEHRVFRKVKAFKSGYQYYLPFADMGTRYQPLNARGLSEQSCPNETKLTTRE